MITIAMSTVIGAEPDRVWRALTDPSELSSWDERIIAPVDRPQSYPISGQHVRWRYRLGSVQLVMHDRPREIVPMKRLQSHISIGSLRYEQTFTLTPEGTDAPRTRLSLKLVASNSVPLVGDIVDRHDVRRMSVAHIDESLRSIQKWCEIPI